MSLESHPELEDLVEEPPSPASLDHLEHCARCRVHRRMARLALGPQTLSLPGLGTARARMAGALREASLSMTSSVGPEATREPDLLEIGETFEGYAVESWLGRGGMGSVYRVRRLEDGAVYALKVMSRSGMDERARREKLAQRRVRHENVVRVRHGLDVNGSPALIMDYVAGPDLAAWLNMFGPPALELADPLAEGLMRGLFAIHMSGFIHRDLKPRNVLLAPDLDAPGGIVPKITDFGLARPVDMGADTRLTRSGMAMGTPGYMAPEQARDAHRATTSADVFSLGAVLYQLLTGERPFGSGTLIQVLQRSAQHDYPALDSTLPPRIRSSLARALQPDPADRFPDVAGFLAAWRGLSV